MSIKPYQKVLTPIGHFGVCAIYEPHPFRDSFIQAALNSSGLQSNQHTSIMDDAWCWVYYDWCGNAIGVGNQKPEGRVVEKFTAEHFHGDQNLADYLNYDMP